MDLAAGISDYYFAHSAELSPQKRFHLANRLASWNGDSRALALLHDCRAWYVPTPLNSDTLAVSFEHAAGAARDTAPQIAAYELRKPYFDRYPALLGLEAELFHLRHLETLYGIDARAVFSSLHALPQLLELEKNLLADGTALRALSSWAVNYSYLLHRVLLKDNDGVDITALQSAAQGYETDNNQQLRLLVYLFTHSIIAESVFYSRPIPPQYLATYRGMLAQLEQLITADTGRFSLDTRLEFLVCCRICDYQTPLFDLTYKECAASVSNAGMFIVDTRNTYASDGSKKTFEASEHRNVLLIMSTMPYAPHSVQV